MLFVVRSRSGRDKTKHTKCRLYGHCNWFQCLLACNPTNAMRKLQKHDFRTFPKVNPFHWQRSFWYAQKSTKAVRYHGQDWTDLKCSSCVQQCLQNLWSYVSPIFQIEEVGERILRTRLCPKKHSWMEGGEIYMLRSLVICSFQLILLWWLE